MVRPTAIRGVPGAEPSTIELGLHALATGYRVTVAPRTLARLRGPRSLSESLRRRFDRTSALRRRAGQRLGQLPSSVRRAFRVSLADPLAAVQRVLLVVVAVLALGFGRLPLAPDSPGLVAAVALTAYGTRWHAHQWLGRGRLGLLRLFRNELRCIGVDLAFGRPALFSLAGSRTRVLGVLTAALAGAVTLGTIGAWRGWARMSTTETAVTLAFTAGFLIVAVDVVARWQRRVDHRVRLGHVAARLDDRDGQLHDLSLGGCAVVVPGAEAHSIGTEATVSFRIPDADGAWRDVAAPVRVAHVAPLPDGAVRLGLAFLAPVDPSLDPVVEFLTIDRRLVALGRRHLPDVEDDWAAVFATPG